MYGRPALVVGIENGAQASVHFDRLSSIDVEGQTALAGEGELGCAFEALLQTFGAPVICAQVRLGVPPGCGLGASAAVGVAVARAVLELTHPNDSDSESLDRILRAAHAWETVFHGKPSGIDATAATLGGCFVYTKGKYPNAVRLQKPLVLAVAVADKPANTKTMVDWVAARLSRDSRRTTEVFDAIDDLVNSAQLALANGVEQSLGELMDQNHALLQELGVSTERLDRACDTAREAGALGAKLTGSGGGGCVVALCKSTTDPVLRSWKSQGLTCFETLIHPSQALPES